VTSFRNANNLFDIGEIVERGLEFSFSFGGMAVLSSRGSHRARQGVPVTSSVARGFPVFDGCLQPSYSR
jgi:hypothetical protein